MKTFKQFQEAQVGKDRLAGALLKKLDKDINKQYKVITSPKDPNTAEKLLKGV